MKSTNLFERWYGQPFKRSMKFWVCQVRPFRCHQVPARIFEARATSYNNNTGELFLTSHFFKDGEPRSDKLAFKIVEYEGFAEPSSVEIKERVFGEHRSSEIRFKVFRHEGAALDFLDARREIERLEAEAADAHSKRQKALIRMSEANGKFMSAISLFDLSGEEIDKFVDEINALCDKVTGQFQRKKE